MMADVWYRYDDYDQPNRFPWLQEIPIRRWTAKCVVLDEFGRERFVLKDARKRYAYPTKELALASYIIRKQRQIQHAATMHDAAVNCLEMAERLRDGKDETPDYDEALAAQARFPFV